MNANRDISPANVAWGDAGGRVAWYDSRDEPDPPILASALLVELEARDLKAAADYAKEVKAAMAGTEDPRVDQSQRGEQVHFNGRRAEIALSRAFPEFRPRHVVGKGDDGIDGWFRDFSVDVKASSVEAERTNLVVPPEKLVKADLVVLAAAPFQDQRKVWLIGWLTQKAWDVMAGPSTKGPGLWVSREALNPMFTFSWIPLRV